MTHMISKFSLLLLALCLVATAAVASIDVSAGPYRVKMRVDPNPVPVGAGTITFDITDQKGSLQPDLEVMAIAQMPGMFMGERESRANPVPGKPGSYSMSAAFPMGGAYEVVAKISGGLGDGVATIPVRTGQDTSSAASGFSIWSVVPYLIAVAIIAFVAVRMRKTGQQVGWKSIFNRSTVGGVAVLGVLLALAIYAVNNMRRQGAMTPIEAQVMDMNTPAPAGRTAVKLATAERGQVSETVRYSGQAVGFVEQDVNPRVTGVIEWMGVYVGDRVKKGQVIARLDASQLDPQLAERSAMTDMAIRGVEVATSEYRTALQEVAEARSELTSKSSMVEEAQSLVDAAKQDRQAAASELAALKPEVEVAQSAVVSATENAKYRAEELRRAQRLYEQGVISKSELDEQVSLNADAQAKVSQAQSAVRQAQAKVLGASANVRKSDSMLTAAHKRVSQTQADVRVARARIQSKESAAQAAKGAIAKEQAAVAQAQAGYRGASAQRGYSSIKAEVDGVVTQRLVSPGVLVAPGQTILKIAQISPIRLQANVAGVDIDRISAGTAVTITSRGGKKFRTQVRSVSPAVDPEARTGIVEAIFQNTDGALLPGQFLDFEFEVGNTLGAVHIPVEAVVRIPGETATDRAQVWVASPSGDQGVYTVRRVSVRTGASNGKRIAVLSGLEPGTMVVVQGGSNLREGGEVAAATDSIKAKGPVVEVFAAGFKPDTVTVESGKPVTITFIRRSAEGCGTEVAFPELGIEKPLPLNQAVEVTITPKKVGELRFACGMDMLRGKVVVQ